jgi:hypothetical protein
LPLATIMQISAPTKLYEPLDPGSMTTETDHVILRQAPI